MTFENSENLPLVSIVVPVFNGEKYLRTSLDSIVNQTYPRIEILVMDDASTDSTPEIIGGYGNKVQHIRQSQNKGQFDNVNDGLDIARGKYTAIYHADDLYDSKIVEREVEFLEKHAEVGAVFCYDIFINAEGREYNRLTISKELRTKSCLDYHTVLNGIQNIKTAFYRLRARWFARPSTKNLEHIAARNFRSLPIWKCGYESPAIIQSGFCTNIFFRIAMDTKTLRKFITASERKRKDNF